MRAVVLADRGCQEVETVTLVDPAPREVVIRTSAALACVTDFIQRSGGGALSEPHIRGHAGVGIVEAIGAAVTRVVVGERVLVPTRPQCGQCFWCVRGQAEQCELTTRPGPVIAVRSDGTALRGSARVGSFAELMKVNEAQVLPVPASAVADDELVTLGCGAGGGLGAALCVASIDSGSSVLVLGAGVFGLSAVQGARIAGAGRVIVVEPIPERRDLALALGASDALEPTPELAAEVRAMTGGRGADTVLECVGAASAVETAFELTRIGGDLVVGSFARPSDRVTLPLNALALRGKRLLSCQYGKVNILRDLPRFIGLVESGRFDARALLTSTCSLDSLEGALARQGDHRELGVVLIP
jgi:S-(hydroxymethyl)glutathione dehydrogenase/alcohol dehydrogenase